MKGIPKSSDEQMARAIPRRIALTPDSTTAHVGFRCAADL